MANRIEIEGSPNQIWIWEGKANCPMTGEDTKSILCPKRNECELLTITVKAADPSEAETYIDYAAATGGIPKCINGKTFLVRGYGFLIPIQPRSVDDE